MSELAPMSPLFRIFRLSTIAIISMTLLLKLVSLCLFWRKLTSPDPLFLAVGSRWVMVLACSTEIVYLFLVWRNPTRQAFYTVTAWVSAVFLTYRIGLLGVGYHGTCLCAGMPLSFLVVLDHQVLENFLFYSAISMFIGSAGCWVADKLLIE